MIRRWGAPRMGSGTTRTGRTMQSELLPSAWPVEEPSYDLGKGGQRQGGQRAAGDTLFLPRAQAGLAMARPRPTGACGTSPSTA